VVWQTRLVTIVRRCEEADFGQVEATLTRAFFDYPPMRWMIEDEGYDQRLRTIIGLVTRGVRVGSSGYLGDRRRRVGRGVGIT
jgi:hypothetical protein